MIHIRILDIKVNQFRGNNPEHVITKQLFNPDLGLCKRKKINIEEKITLVLPTNFYHPQTDYSLILYLGNGNYDQNMHYPCSRYIYFSTTYNMSVYDVTYKTIVHTQPVISTASDMD